MSQFKQEGIYILELLVGFYILDHIHPRERKRHGTKHDTERVRKLDAEEDDESAEAEETAEEGLLPLGGFAAEGESFEGLAELAADNPEFLALL